MKLFSNYKSAASHRLRIALALKGVDHTVEEVQLAAGHHRRPEYASLNPMRQVPVLIDGPRVLIQSLAILEYIEEVYPEPPLLPSDPHDRARVRGIADTIACEIHPLLTRRVVGELRTTFGQERDQVEKWYRYWIAEGFSAVERLLTEDKRTGRFCHGDAPTLADVCLLPQVEVAVANGCPLDAYPTIRRIATACRELPAFASTSPTTADAVE
ncbi:MAG: maleylacetoacetate isomerase [Rhodospirillaceae bacterium]|nr:maleylacetoacetate isomerase [Rhodospirillaceae bacterium]